MLLVFQGISCYAIRKRICDIRGLTMGKRGTIIGIIVVVAAIAIMIVAFAGNNTSYMYEVGQYYDEIETLGDKSVRVRGDYDHITEDLGNTIVFTITDITDPSLSLTISYTGPIRADMRNPQSEGIIEAKGKYDFDKKIFTAKELIMECASKYEPAT